MNSLSRNLKLYIGSMIILATLFLLYFTPSTLPKNDKLNGVIFFIMLAVYTDLLPVSLPRGGTVSVSVVATFSFIILFSPIIACYIIIIATLINGIISKQEGPWYKLIFNCSQLCLSVGISSLLFHSVSGGNSLLEWDSLFAFMIMTITFSLFNCTAVSLVISLSQGIPMRIVWRENVRWVLPNYVLLAPLGLLIAVSYNLAGPLGVAIFIIPLLLARFVFKSYMDMREVYLNTLTALAVSLDAKDQYTRGHSERVSEYATMICRYMGLPEEQVETIQHMALLHDVGKIGVSDNILCKPDRLTNDEYENIKKHSAIGARIIESMESLGDNKEFILYHHEQYSGGGYPTGVAGDKIPLGARIITVADSFDAMTTDRSYRPKRSIDEAFHELRKMAGTQFDPNIVEAFISALDEKSLNITTTEATVVSSK